MDLNVVNNLEMTQSQYRVGSDGFYLELLL